MRPTTRQFQKLHVVPDVPHDLEHVAMPDLAVHLLLGPREGHLRLGGKEGAILVNTLPRCDFEDRLPVLRYLPKHPDRRCFQLVLLELVLEWRGFRLLVVAPFMRLPELPIKNPLDRPSAHATAPLTP